MKSRPKAMIYLCVAVAVILLIAWYFATFPHKKTQPPSVDISGIGSARIAGEDENWRKKDNYKALVEQYGEALYIFDGELYYVSARLDAGEPGEIDLSPDTVFTKEGFLAYYIWTGPKKNYYVYFAYVPETDREYIVELLDSGSGSLTLSDAKAVLKRIIDQ